MTFDIKTPQISLPERPHTSLHHVLQTREDCGGLLPTTPKRCSDIPKTLLETIWGEPKCRAETARVYVPQKGLNHDLPPTLSEKYLKNGQNRTFQSLKNHTYFRHFLSTFHEIRFQTLKLSPSNTLLPPLQPKSSTKSSQSL